MIVQLGSIDKAATQYFTKGMSFVSLPQREKKLLC